MKTLVILSDTHRNLEPIQKIGRVLDECDYIVHLGDMASDAKELLKCYPEKTYVIKGNNDLYGGIDEFEFEVEQRKIFACHGHKYNVKSGIDSIVDVCKRRGCDIALYGHTHTAEVREKDGVLIINPGAMTRYTPNKSYCYLVIEKAKAVATIVNIREWI